MKPSLEEFLKCKKVKCVKAHYNSLTVGKEYSVLNIRIGVEVIDNEGSKYYWRANHFEPVLDSAENPLQDMKLTPEFEAVVPHVNPPSNNDTYVGERNFKAGDKVYIPNIKNICTIRDDGKVITSNGQHYCDLSDSYDLCFVLATPENHALLSKLYPHIEFEQPTKELKGSDLCRAMLEKGWKYVPCYVHDGSDDEAINRKHYVSVKNETPRSGYNFSGTGANDWKYAVPIDPRTGEPLTEAVLDEQKP